MQSKIDVKEKLFQYLPSLFLLINTDSFAWNKINKGLAKRYEQLKLKAEKRKEPLIIEASLYNIIIESINGNAKALVLLKFFDNLLYELSITLSDREKIMIKKNLMDVLTNFDKNYLNFWGELAVLNQLTKSNIYKLLSVEEPVDRDNPDGTSVDFKFFNVITNKEGLIEVVNIHLTDGNTSSNEYITRLLSQKLHEKVLSTAAKTKVNFFLVPVMWGSVEEVKKIKNFYKDQNFSLEGVLPPSCFISYSDLQGNVSYKFGTVDTIDL